MKVTGKTKKWEQILKELKEENNRKKGLCKCRRCIEDRILYSKGECRCVECVDNRLNDLKPKNE